MTTLDWLGLIFLVIVMGPVMFLTFAAVIIGFLVVVGIIAFTVTGIQIVKKGSWRDLFVQKSAD